MIIHEDLTKTRIVFHEVQKRLDSVRAVQKAIRDQRQSDLAAIGAVQKAIREQRQSDLAAIGAAQKALKEQTAVFPPLSIDFAAIHTRARPEASPSPGYGRGPRGRGVAEGVPRTDAG